MGILPCMGILPLFHAVESYSIVFNQVQTADPGLSRCSLATTSIGRRQRNPSNVHGHVTLCPDSNREIYTLCTIALSLRWGQRLKHRISDSGYRAR